MWFWEKRTFPSVKSRFPRLKTLFYLPHKSDTAPIIKIWIQIIHFYWSAEAIKTSQPFTQTKFLAQRSFLVQRFPSQQPGSATLSERTERPGAVELCQRNNKPKALCSGSRLRLTLQLLKDVFKTSCVACGPNVCHLRKGKSWKVGSQRQEKEKDNEDKEWQIAILRLPYPAGGEIHLIISNVYTWMWLGQ